MQKKVI